MCCGIVNCKQKQKEEKKERKKIIGCAVNLKKMSLLLTIFLVFLGLIVFVIVIGAVVTKFGSDLVIQKGQNEVNLRF